MNNALILILVLILIAALCYINLTKTNIEGFDKFGFNYVSKTHTQPLLNPVNYNLLTPPHNNHNNDLTDMLYETRHPQINKIKYSYNDSTKPHSYNPNDLYMGHDIQPTPKLKELTDLQPTFNNQSHATVTPKFLKHNPLYIDEIKTTKHITEEKQHWDRYPKLAPTQTNPYNPNDFLPGQYADRSKTSFERNAGAYLNPLFV